MAYDPLGNSDPIVIARKKYYERSSETINPRPFFVFRHLRQWRGVGKTPPPPGDRPLMVVELRGKNSRPVSMRSRDCTYFYSPRSTFDLVRSDQMPNFRENDILWLYTLIVAYVSYRSETFTGVFPVQF